MVLLSKNFLLFLLCRFTPCWQNCRKANKEEGVRIFRNTATKLPYALAVHWCSDVRNVTEGSSFDLLVADAEQLGEDLMEEIWPLVLHIYAFVRQEMSILNAVSGIFRLTKTQCKEHWRWFGWKISFEQCKSSILLFFANQKFWKNVSLNKRKILPFAIFEFWFSVQQVSMQGNTSKILSIKHIQQQSCYWKPLLSESSR